MTNVSTTTRPLRLALAHTAASLLVALVPVPVFCANAASDIPQLRMQSAERMPGAERTTILSVARAGARLVAVGERGVVLLSDDDGKTYRQAREVPVNSTLTSVWFNDERNGWAVGHWGAVVHSVDGGETWAAQRSDIKVDQPLFGVYFKNAREGWAVGLWSLLLHTVDAGQNWTTVALPPPRGAKKADRNLYSIFADAKGGLYVASEQGRILRSSDNGANWSYIETGYAGSFWAGVALQDGTLLVGGLRGTIYRSADAGTSWTQVRTPFKSSITAMLQFADRSVVAVGLDGVTFVSRDNGLTFTGQQRADRETLTALAETRGGKPLMFSVDGPTPDQMNLIPALEKGHTP